MNANPVGWFEIYVRDMQRARAFYEQVFGVTLQPLENTGVGVAEMWAFPMRQGGAGAAGALVRMEGDGPSGNGVLVYFTCDDCAREATRVAQHGGRVVKEKFAIGDSGFIAIATDTEGNAIGPHSMR